MWESSLLNSCFMRIFFFLYLSFFLFIGKNSKWFKMWYIQNINKMQNLKTIQETLSSVAMLVQFETVVGGFEWSEQNSMSYPVCQLPCPILLLQHISLLHYLHTDHRGCKQAKKKWVQEKVCACTLTAFIRKNRICMQRPWKCCLTLYRLLW